MSLLPFLVAARRLRSLEGRRPKVAKPPKRAKHGGGQSLDPFYVRRARAPDGRELKIAYDGSVEVWTVSIAGSAQPAAARRLRAALARAADDLEDAPWIVALADHVEAPFA
jgi:hypothetical protein